VKVEDMILVGWIIYTAIILVFVLGGAE